MTEPLDNKPCGLTLHPHPSHRYMQNAKVWRCPGTPTGPHAWAEHYAAQRDQHPVRHTVDTITSDALDQLYARIDTLTAVCRSNQRAYVGAVKEIQAAEQRAEQVETALARVRAAAEQLIEHGSFWDGCEPGAGRTILDAIELQEPRP
ncbi:hypothetical protein [Streptomyces sp. A1136]|uniref:hypothetical protein n=1 Tax=Streptomyces sp. A1136 TaxID=2563102 RepID=UPI00109EB1F0|nr:hypothetical protein [Streptomyces sp. A1136]THA56125.1 hypothetical protein E6R62_12325 [Streptomyces sp. A1136]